MKKLTRTVRAGRTTPPPPEKFSLPIAMLVLALLTGIAYAPAAFNELTNWDDDVYVTNNRSLGDFSPADIAHLFSPASYFQGNYHPLTMLSLGLDHTLGGVNPAVYHLVNILLHLANTLLVFLFISALVRDRRVGFVAAIIFGVHTLHVESVAWVSERKDLLYSAFFLSSLILYVKYSARRARGLYLGSLGLFFLSLLCKGQAVALPLVLVAIDLFLKKYPLNRKSLVEKAPYFALAIIFGVIAVLAQKTGGAVRDVHYLDRIPSAACGFTQYIIKLFFPWPLSAFYPYPMTPAGQLPAPLWLYVIPACGVLALFFHCIRAGGKDRTGKGKRGAAFGMAFFIVNVIFVLQLFPVGRAIMADRYAYLASVGFCLVAGLAWRHFASMPSFKNIAHASVVAFVLMLAVMTFLRAQIWHDSFRLWNDVIAKHPESFEAFANRGIARMGGDDVDGAIRDCGRSLQLYPENAPALSCRGLALYRKSRQESNPSLKASMLQQAAADLQKSLQLVFQQPNERLCLGQCFLDIGNLREAISQFRTALSLDPANKNALNSIGYSYFQANQPDSTLRYCSRALELDPNYAAAIGNMGLAFQQKANYPRAAECYERAIALDRNIDQAYIRNCVSIYGFLKNAQKVNFYGKMIR